MKAVLSSIGLIAIALSAKADDESWLQAGAPFSVSQLPPDQQLQPHATSDGIVAVSKARHRINAYYIADSGSAAFHFESDKTTYWTFANFIDLIPIGKAKEPSSGGGLEAGATTTSPPAMVQGDTFTEPAPMSKPTPVPATALSIPKGFNGDVTGIKLFLNEAPDVWIKYYGNKAQQNIGGLDYTWYVGRFQLGIGFDRRSHKADAVNISAQPCQTALTLDEAKKLMASLGLKTSRSNSNRANSAVWGDPDEAVYASYRGGESGGAGLLIQTSLFQRGGFIED
jgi:hypothetical protein